MQDFEARQTIQCALPKLPPEEQKAMQDLLNEFWVHLRAGGGQWGYSTELPQTEPGLDLLGYMARLHAAAAMIQGVTDQPAWDQPPK